MMATVKENVNSFEILNSQLERGYAQVPSSSPMKGTGVHMDPCMFRHPGTDIDIQHESARDDWHQISRESRSNQ